MPSEMVERIAQALDGAEVGYRIELTRLVDGESTYTLHIRGEVLEFNDTDGAYEHVRQVKNRVRALAVLKALREPTDGMLGAAQTAWLRDPGRRTSTLYRAMIDHEIKLAEGGQDDR